MDGFDPRGCKEDRRLLFEVCKMRIDVDDFRDSSSDEEFDSKAFAEIGDGAISGVSQQLLLGDNSTNKSIQNGSSKRSASALTIN